MVPWRTINGFGRCSSVDQGRALQQEPPHPCRNRRAWHAVCGGCGSGHWLSSSGPGTSFQAVAGPAVYLSSSIGKRSHAAAAANSSKSWSRSGAETTRGRAGGGGTRLVASKVRAGNGGRRRGGAGCDFRGRQRGRRLRTQGQGGRGESLPTGGAGVGGRWSRPRSVARRGCFCPRRRRPLAFAEVKSENEARDRGYSRGHGASSCGAMVNGNG
jgi:hypothetical protein